MLWLVVYQCVTPVVTLLGAFRSCTISDLTFVEVAVGEFSDVRSGVVVVRVITYCIAVDTPHTQIWLVEVQMGAQSQR